MPAYNVLYRLAWIGPADDNCEALLHAFERTCEETGRSAEIIKLAELQLDAIADYDRIVLTAPTRHEYPHSAVRTLTTVGNIVPWSVVTGSWHVGSRRSGDGPTTHFQQPWFRWWDSWLGWFFPECMRLGSITPALFSPIITPLDMALGSGAPEQSLNQLNHDFQSARATATSAPQRQLLILCACPNTAQMWANQARHIGWRSQLEVSTQPSSTQPRLPAASIGEGPILWDDSLLPCLPGTDLLALVHEDVIPGLARCEPRRFIIALGLENLYLWPSFATCGCQTLLVKPSYALALGNYLYYTQNRRQVA